MIAVMLLVASTMGIKDVLYNAATVFVAREKALPAAIFDTLGDFASLLTYGVGGVTVVRYGVSIQSALILAAMGVGSLIGAYGGVGVAQFFERRMGIKAGT